MDKIVECFKTLGHLATQIQHNVQITKLAHLNKESLDSQKLEGFYSSLSFSGSIKSLSLNMILILANSYLDELYTQLTPNKHPKYDKEILSYLSVINPALSRIKEWKDLKDFRNQFLVHNYRHKGASIFSKAHSIKKFKIPQTDREILLLAELICLINKQHYVFFPKEIDRALEDGDKIIDRYSYDNKLINFREEFGIIEKSVVTNVETYKIKYHLKTKDE